MVIIFLVVPHPGNQVGPVTTSMYSCHTHELCPSILHWRVEHRKRQSHCLPFPIPASHACESYFKNEDSNKCSWKSMELGHRGQHMHVSQPSLYTERARTCAHTHSSFSLRICCRHKNSGGPSLAVFSKPVSHTCNSSPKQSADSTGCKHSFSVELGQRNEKMPLPFLNAIRNQPQMGLCISGFPWSFPSPGTWQESMQFLHEGLSVLPTLEGSGWERNENKVLVFSLTHELSSTNNMDNLEIG